MAVDIFGKGSSLAMLTRLQAVLDQMIESSIVCRKEARTLYRNSADAGGIDELEDRIQLKYHLVLGELLANLLVLQALIHYIGPGGVTRSMHSTTPKQCYSTGNNSCFSRRKFTKYHT